MFTPDIRVRIKLMHINGHIMDNEPDTTVYSSIEFQRNETKKLAVDGHPFIIKYGYPIIDVMYDNSTKDLLTSINLSMIDDSDFPFETGETSLNELDYYFSVEVTITDRKELV